MEKSQMSSRKSLNAETADLIGGNCNEISRFEGRLAITQMETGDEWR